MRKTAFAAMTAIVVWGAAWSGTSTAAPQGEVPAPLQSAAECMARVLRGTPGVMNVEISVGPGGGYPILAYGFADPAGRRRFTELSLFQIDGIDDAPYVFDRADIQGDVVAERLLPVWKARCRAGLGYITSVPR